MPLLWLLVGLAVLDRLSRDKDQPEVKATYLLPVGQVIFIPAGMKAVIRDDLTLLGPVYVRADAAKTETVFADLGLDGTHSITWP